MSIYLGRIVAVGQTRQGRNAACYRVSSRSFPNRHIVAIGSHLAIVPRPGFEKDIAANPYIAYTCIRMAGPWLVVSNGSHTDPIAERLADGVPPKLALGNTLLALDYERDHLNTPRIAGVIGIDSPTAWLAIVRRDALIVREVELAAGRMHYLSTYEACDVRPEQVVPISVAAPDELARASCDGDGFREFTHAVTAGAGVASGGAFHVGTYTVPA